LLVILYQEFVGKNVIMAEDVIKEHYDKMKEMFGKLLPNPNIYPKQFQYYVNLYLYYLKRTENLTGELVKYE